MKLEHLTLGEIDRIETLSGLSIEEIGETGAPKGKLMAALVFITKRREEGNSKFAFTDALAMSLEESEAALEWFFADDEDPKELETAPEETPSSWPTQE